MRKKMWLGLAVALMIFISACQPKEQEEEWKDSSPSFTTNHGEMFGKEGKIGIIGSKKVTENGQKWMWHFWGNSEISNKTWEVKAFKQGEKKAINPIRFKDETLVPRGEDVKGHARSAVLFPSSGLWKLKVYIDGDYFDEIVVEIHQE